MKKCVKCGREILDRTLICPYCSEEQSENIQQPEKIKVDLSKGINYIQKSDVMEHQKETKYCPRCGNEVNISSHFCSKCGALLEDKQEETEEKKKYPDVKEIENKLKQNPKGILKVFCILMACIYGGFALHDIQYVTSYYVNTLWGTLMMLAGAWNAFILLVIGFRCQKEYGKNLMYGLFAGSAAKIVLHIYNIYISSKYYINSSGDIYGIIGILAVAGIGNYLLKKNDFILSGENSTVIQVFRDIPWALKMALGSEENYRETAQRSGTKEKIIWGTDFPKGRLQAILLSRAFFVFAILYTGDLLVNVLTDFSLFKVVFQTLPILFCTGIWMIYYNRYKKRMSTAGFTLINVLFIIKMCFRILVMVVVTYALWKTGDTGIVVALFVILLILLDVLYWYSLNKTVSSMKKCTYGEEGEVEIHASWYPTVVLILQTITKAFAFIIACYMQSLANALNSSLNQYGDEASSAIGYITEQLGLGFGLGFELSSEGIGTLLEPVNAWIQSVLGFNQSPLIMLLAIAVTVSSIVLLSKIRSYRSE